MHSMITMFAYMATQPSLPRTSILAVIVGVVLMFGRNRVGLVTRRVRLARLQRTRDEGSRGPHSDPAAAYRT